MATVRGCGKFGCSGTLTVTGGRRSPSPSTSSLLLRHMTGFSAVSRRLRPDNDPARVCMHQREAIRHWGSCVSCTRTNVSSEQQAVDSIESSIHMAKKL